ncbi:DDB1- and CUL4-associated factor 17 [Chanos chanos]|uniref:DDB1- and CUL4-associated factor 17 n=1 Tax=Chanos chanos TaxID=29144 RepID=A0A6J2WE32_CHACN|nr:DDB1- and CUL4-associated factor 17 [Chanos chanos]
MCSKKPVCALRPRARKQPNKNACALIHQRTSGISSNDVGTLLRNNLKILRNIILQESAEFVKVWSKSSKSLISYENGRIYFENYRCCYNSHPTKPQRLYELPRRSKAEKIEDSLLCQCPLGTGLPRPSDQKPSLLVLTANNWLYRLSADTGEQLQKVYLASHFKFRCLGWDVSQETFFVKSIQNKQTPLARQAGLDVNVLMHLAVFRVFPLELIGMLELNKTVFGRTVVDVLLSQSVLAVSHSTKSVKLYSFEHIVSKFRTQELVLGQQCDVRGVTGTVGEAPFGIPVNIHITECPPVLFEVSYFENGIQIGGHPWHYIYTPNHKKHRGSHHICSIRNGALAVNGVQEMNCDSLESDWIFFHPDDSGRIIHVGPSTIKVLKIITEQGCDSQSEVVEDFSVTANRDHRALSQVTVTSSGRTVKRRFHQLDDDPEQETFRMLKYEDELDLLAVVDVTQSEDEGKARVRLHDNKSGEMMKIVPLKESWDVTYSHELYFDRDTIIHIEQERNNSFCCHVYKTSRGRGDREEE